MRKSDELATVTVLHQTEHVGSEAPFQRFWHANLVNAQFAIDGRRAFWGYHDPYEDWNGWATPGFIREVTGLIMDWLNDDEPGTAWWDGEVLNVNNVDSDYVDVIEPDELGLYHFGGWIWLEVAEAD